MALLPRLVAAVLLATAAACTQAAFPPVVLEGTQVRTLLSANGDAYRILVAVPAGQAPAQGWPVIYALDGATTFATFRDSVRVQAGRPEATGARPAVVVAIAYPDPGGVNPARRQRDLTPPVPGQPVATSGGAEPFLDFLEKVVKPAVERDLPIDRRRQTLFGHSLGGLFALHVLFTRPDAFQTYVAASPSIWWNDRAILAEMKAVTWPAVPPAVMVTVGEREQFAPDADVTSVAKLARRRQVDNAAEMAAGLAAMGIDVAFVCFPGENHGSVLPAAISRAVRFASR